MHRSILSWGAVILMAIVLPFVRLHALTEETSQPKLIEKAIGLLRQSYVYPSQIKFQRSDRLETFLARLQGGATLESSDDYVSTPSENISADLPSPAGPLRYIRTAWTHPPNVDLPDFDLGHVPGVILDLRNSRSDNLELARALALILAPIATPNLAFTITPPRSGNQVPSAASAPAPTQPRFKKPLVILINQETSGAPELLAALLHQSGACLVGSSTSGAAGVFATATLAPQVVMRYAISDILLPDGHPLLRHPVKPDIELNIPAETEAALVAKIEQGQIMTLIQEPKNRPKMSEAALVRGENPVRDAVASPLLPRSSTDPAASPAAEPRDECLLQGIACLETLLFSKRHSL